MVRHERWGMGDGVYVDGDCVRASEAERNGGFRRGQVTGRAAAVRSIERSYHLWPHGNTAHTVPPCRCLINTYTRISNRSRELAKRT